MKLILVKEVSNLGQPGDLIEVAPGYARNYLIPGGLAVIATEKEILKWQEERSQRQREALEEKEKISKIAEKLSGEILIIKTKTTESGKLFGSIKSQDIVKELEKLGYKISKDAIEMENIKKVGNFKVVINLGCGIKVEVSLKVEGSQK